MIRNVLLGIYAIAWLFVMIITEWRTGTIPPELWLYLGIGAGGLLGIFRAEEKVSGRPPKDEEKAP
jgi:hypothetical protein